MAGFIFYDDGSDMDRSISKRQILDTMGISLVNLTNDGVFLLQSSTTWTSARKCTTLVDWRDHVVRVQGQRFTELYKVA